MVTAGSLGGPRTSDLLQQVSKHDRESGSGGRNGAVS